MAEDLRLRLIFEGKDAKRKLERFNKVMRQTDDVAKQSTTSFNEFQGKILGFGAQFAAAAAIVAAEKKVFDFAREGASADLARQQFGELAEELGTTADVLLPKLQQETDGLISNFGAMQQATDFLRLGLVSTEDQLVRLTAASAELGFDLNELTLALANQSKRRLDQLGISVTVFNQKLEELEAQGLSTSDAFTEAFLLSAEEQIERVGSQSDTAAGEIRRLESSWEDLSMTGAQLTSRGLAPMIENLNDLIFAYRNAQGPVDLWLDANLAILNAYRNMIGLQPIVTDQQEENTQQLDSFGRAARRAGSSARGFVGEMALVNQTEFDLPENELSIFAVAGRKAEDRLAGILGHLEHLQRIQEAMQGKAPLTESLGADQFEGVEAKLAGLVSEETFNRVGGLNESIQDAVEAAKGISPAISSASSPAQKVAETIERDLLPVLNPAAKAAQQINEQLRAIPEEIDVSINILTSGGSGIPGFAGGGPLGPLSLVGERGPELVINGVVIDAQTTRRLRELGLVPTERLAFGGGLTPGQTSGSGGGGVSPSGTSQIAPSGGGGTSGPTQISFGTGGGGTSVAVSSGGGGGGGGATQQVSAEQTISAVAQTAAQATQQTSAQVSNQLQRAERTAREQTNVLRQVLGVLQEQASADELRSINVEAQDTSRF